jgi:hypothetical protein
MPGILHVEPPLELRPPLEQVFPLFIRILMPPLAFVDTCVYALAASIVFASIVAGVPCPIVIVGGLTDAQGASLAVASREPDTQNVSVSCTFAVILMRLAVLIAIPPKSATVPGVAAAV